MCVWKVSSFLKEEYPSPTGEGEVVADLPRKTKKKSHSVRRTDKPPVPRHAIVRRTFGSLCETIRRSCV
jgi:hypothetical protein